MDLNTHCLKILKRPTLRLCSEYQHRTTFRSVAHTSVSQVRLGSDFLQCDGSDGGSLVWGWGRNRLLKGECLVS